MKNIRIVGIIFVGVYCSIWCTQTEFHGESSLKKQDSGRPGKIAGAACAAKPIMSSTTLTKSGTYCLANDINGKIDIKGSSITLDLNGYTINSDGHNAISIFSDSVDVRIKNGFIWGSNCEGCGIYVEDAVGIRISEITTMNHRLGICLKGSKKVTIDNVLSLHNTSDGLQCKDVINLIVRDSCFNDNYEHGIQVLGHCGSCGIRIHNCHVDGDDQNGISIQNAACVELIECTATGGCGDRCGFYFVHSADVVARCCRASGYLTGFLCDRIESGILLDCISRRNRAKGFEVRGSSGTVILRSCIAKNNYGIGFFDDKNPSSNMYVSCIACDNKERNYSQGIVHSHNAPVTSAENVRGFANVDCADRTRDQVIATLHGLGGH